MSETLCYEPDPAPKPANYRYPFPVSYMVAYAAKVTEVETFISRNETTARYFLNPKEARMTAWVKDNYPLYQAACHQLRIA